MNRFTASQRRSRSRSKGAAEDMAYEMVSLLRMLIDRDGSDLHIAVDDPPRGPRARQDDVLR